MIPEINRIYCGDVLKVLKTWPNEIVDCVVTSPPYWGLRDYGVAGQMGLEKSFQDYLSKMVEVFREVKRVMKPQATLWINMGDAYCQPGSGGHGATGGLDKSTLQSPGHIGQCPTKKIIPPNLKQKDLIGMPWRVAFALQDDGWYLRSDIIWSKPNPMPESVKDRPTRAHEYIFLMSKNPTYYYDYQAIKEPFKETSLARLSQKSFWDQKGGPKDPLDGNRSHRKVLENLKKRKPAGWATGRNHSTLYWNTEEAKRKELPEGQSNLGEFRDKQRGHSRRHNGANKRTVWAVATHAFREAHFATFPPKLIEPCILAGCPPQGIVLDPFMGAGTTGLVARRLGRNFLGIELNPKYMEMAMNRITKEEPLFLGQKNNQEET